jgi:glycerophosphoryl diester phosphodiesterase
MRHAFFDTSKPAILGHRGAAGIAPENTLLGFRTALECGASIIESDLRATRDGVPVLFHDVDLERTTDGRGPLGGLDWQQLRELDAGYRLTLDEGRSFPFRGRGLRIPSLEQSLTALPEAKFNLEIKDPSEALVSRALTCIRNLDASSRVLLTAGDPCTMRLLRTALSGSDAQPATGASSREVARFLATSFVGSDPPGGVMALQIPPTCLGAPLITSRLLRHAHAHGIAVHAWTINEVAEMRRLIDLGVDGIVTDFPGRMAKLLEEASSCPDRS